MNTSPRIGALTGVGIEGNASPAAEPRACVLVVGCGNTGAQVLQLLAANPFIGQLAIADPDNFEPIDMGRQLVTPADVGRPKVEVHARRLQAFNPSLHVIPLKRNVEELPLGRLRVDVLVSNVDNRLARQAINEASMRLGIPWVDVAIDGRAGLARVNAYSGKPDAPCLECGWGPEIYDSLEQRLPCQGAQTEPTAAPLQLGAIAAAYQAHEVDKLLSGRTKQALLGRQLIVDPTHHQHFVDSFQRNRQCRLSHERWSVQIIDTDPAAMTLSDLFAMQVIGGGPTSLGIYRQAFVRRLTCTGCAWQGRPTLALLERLPNAHRTCPDCGEPVIPATGEINYTLAERCVSADELNLGLDRIGFEPGDVVTLAAGDRRRHVQLGAGS